MTDKDPQEIAEALLGQGEEEEEAIGGVVFYKIDPEKLSQCSYQEIADALNEFFGVFAIDTGRGGILVEKFLDTLVGKFLTLDDEREEIL